MTFDEYVLMTETSALDQKLYRSLLIDAATNGPDRLKTILDVFTSLNVPNGFEGNVAEICRQGIAEISAGNYAEDMLKYATLIWALPASVSDAVFHTLEQMI